MQLSPERMIYRQLDVRLHFLGHHRAFGSGRDRDLAGRIVDELLEEEMSDDMQRRWSKADDGAMSERHETAVDLASCCGRKKKKGQ